MFIRNYLLFSRRFSETFLNDAPFKNVLLKMKKKIEKFDLNYQRHMVQLLVLRILGVLCENTNSKKFLTQGNYSPPPTGRVLPPQIQKLYIILLLLT